MGFFSRNKAKNGNLTPEPIKETPPDPIDEKPNLKKRISTILDDEEYDDFEVDDYEEDQDSDESHESDESERDEYEEHNHRLIERKATQSVSQLSTLMGLCGLSSGGTEEGLAELANKELRRTYSLLSKDMKIRRLSPTMHRKDPLMYQSVIEEPQTVLIEEITKKINHVLDLKESKQQQQYLAGNKTLLDRYGSISKVIGRGRYGVIKVILSSDQETQFTKKNGIYAVKELLKRPATESKQKESRETFISRVTSEFILSCTLNNKHIVRTLDLMITVPSTTGATATNNNKKGSLFEDEIKISQVMECTPGGDLFNYLKRAIEMKQYLTIDEIDCVIKQIAKGLWYMHNHGVAHCDLKLENVLLTWDKDNRIDEDDGLRARVNVKISDFGKANVVRTKWDSHEQFFNSGPMGSEPYMAPEEFLGLKDGISLLRKDCWALGIVILVLFNIRRSVFHRGGGGHSCQLEYFDRELGEVDSKSYSSVYLWHTTEPKLLRANRHKDSVFDEFTKNAMKADYNETTREWTIERQGSFTPIETIFDLSSKHIDDKYMYLYDQDADFEQDEYTIRKYFMYKLLDLNPATRVTVDGFLRSDWMSSVESCGS